jgi:hypothetical protein
MERRKKLKIKLSYACTQNERIPGRKKEMGKIKRDNKGKMENENEVGIYKEKDIEKRENEGKQKEARKKCNERTKDIKGERRDRDKERTKKTREMENKTVKKRKTAPGVPEIIFFQGLSLWGCSLSDAEGSSRDTIH